MSDIFLLESPVQEYAWGSRTFIARLLGQPVPSPKPQAELWLGAHPKAPSLVLCREGRIPLHEFIRRDPPSILGSQAARRFSGQLPFLLKVLAADHPLSIQAHPDAWQARQGFAEENERGIPLDAPQRNYRDPFPKPELLAALTPFQALNGFRPAPEILGLLSQVWPQDLRDNLTILERHSAEEALKLFLQSLMLMEPARKEALVSRAAREARKRQDRDPAFAWMARLHEEYPGDAGALAPGMLNLVRLEPGEAMFLEAGDLHAYLEGAGMEIMGSSDNVLRGGLTPKHIDVPQLLRIVRFREKTVNPIRPRQGENGEQHYSTPAREFHLSRLSVSEERPYRSEEDRGAEILLCVEGKARVTVRGPGGKTELEGGKAVLAPACAGAYALEGRAEIYRASIPRGPVAEKSPRIPPS